MIHILTANLLDEICRIEHEAFSDPWSTEMLREELLNPQTVYIGASENGLLTGYAGMQVVLDEGHIHNVAVSPDFRRRGIARSLVEALIDFSRKQSLSVMLLEVRNANLPAIELYASFGFEVVGRRPNYYKNPREDALLMTKVL